MAVATLVVVAGILAGPAILACSAEAGGIGACLRDRIDGAPSNLAVPAGWVEAKAGEAASEAPAVAELTAPGGSLEAAGSAPEPGAAGEAVLAAPVGQLSASAEPFVAAPVELALAPKAGSLDASGDVGASPSLEAASAALSAPPPIPEPEPIPEPQPEPPVFETPLVEISAELPPPVVEPPPPLRFDPAFPNVLVLPAPASGDDSSFRTLQLN